MILKRGLGLRGVVTDEQHNPISGATVLFGEFFGETNPKTQTGADGSFALNSLAAGPGHITITAKNYAPERMRVEISTNIPAMTIQLKPGGLLRLQVVDENGGGVAHARVQLQGWRGNNSLEWGGFTDYQGHIEWDSAPHDQMDLCAMKEGYSYSRENMIVADGVEHTITLHKRIDGFRKCHRRRHQTTHRQLQSHPRFRRPKLGPLWNWRRAPTASTNSP